jgi:hypothetical protein
MTRKRHDCRVRQNEGGRVALACPSHPKPGLFNAGSQRNVWVSRKTPNAGADRPYIFGRRPFQIPVTSVRLGQRCGAVIFCRPSSPGNLSSARFTVYGSDGCAIAPCDGATSASSDVTRAELRDVTYAREHAMAERPARTLHRASRCADILQVGRKLTVSRMSLVSRSMACRSFSSSLLPRNWNC